MKSCDSLNSSQVVHCPNYHEKRRCGVYHKHGVEIYLCSAEDIRAKRLFKNSVDLISNFAVAIEEAKVTIQNDSFIQMERLMHNLRTYNAHCIQSSDLILDPSASKRNAKNQIQEIEDAIIRSPRTTANSLIKIIKNIRFIQGELSIYENLYKTGERQLSPSNHQIHRLVRGVLGIFFNDFQDKDVLISVEPCSSEIFVDYQTFIVSLIHLFDNAVKYCKPSSTINIFFEQLNNKVKMSIEMMSVKILETEKDRVMKEGESGYYSKKLGLAGKGIGMFIVQEFLNINNCPLMINVNANHKMNIEKLGIPYEQNTFVIIMPIKSKLI
jgi:K+-sensing histidine kinase KdpD